MSIMLAALEAVKAGEGRQGRPSRQVRNEWVGPEEEKTTSACPMCERLVRKDVMKRHQRTPACLTARLSLLEKRGAALGSLVRVRKLS